MYYFFKDFAGPLATVIASVIAGVFIYRQWKTAEKQAETALDQLRYNLFEKRFAIYEDVRQLLNSLRYGPDCDGFKVGKHFTVMDKAIFFFSPETCAWLQSLQDDCVKFLEARESKSTNPTEYERSSRHLSEQYRRMPERFQKELGFRQLTQNAPYLEVGPGPPRRIWRP